MLNRFALPVLLLGDLIALGLFVFFGQREHQTIDPTNLWLGMLPHVAAFAIAWLVAGWWLGAFRIPAPFQPMAFFARTLNAWFVATLLGLLLRSFFLNRAVIPAMFIVATLGFGALFLFAWRALFAVIWNRYAKPSP